MKKTNILYWIFTGVISAFMLFSSMPDILATKEAVTFMTQLGYPVYFIPFIGWAKVLGVIAILIPGFPKIKEWAYAGLFFDLIGATYSIIAVYGISPSIIFMLATMGVLALSYIFYHRKIQAV